MHFAVGIVCTRPSTELVKFKLKTKNSQIQFEVDVFFRLFRVCELESVNWVRANYSRLDLRA